MRGCQALGPQWPGSGPGSDYLLIGSLFWSENLTAVPDMRSKRQGRPAGQKKGAQKIQYGGGSKGSTGGKGKKKRPIEDDEDDEEIDEDLAFNEEDERKYGDLLREIAENDERKRKRPGDYNSEDDMDDDEDIEDDDDGGG